jgi:hypothetical protein
MRKLTFALGVLAIGFAASTPARADFVVVRFDPGYCQVWTGSNTKPTGTGWHVVGKPYATWQAATSAVDSARAKKLCR